MSPKRPTKRRMTAPVPSRSMVAGEVLPPNQPPAQSPTLRRIGLRDIDAIRREMSRVYRDARRGQIETTIAARLVYMLSEIRKTYEVSVLERRLTALEGQP